MTMVKHSACLLFGLLLTMAAAADTLRVAVAANFRAPMQDIVAGFESQTRHRVKVSAASTGVIYNQIRNGAPFDLFLAADSRHPQLLERDGLAASPRRTYAWGQLVLAYRPELFPGANATSPSIAELLSRPGLSLAVAHPEHAPYGIAARETLSRFKTSSSLKLVRGANVGQAFQMWHSGNADMALVGSAFAPRPHISVPQRHYTPLQQQAVVLQTRSQVAAHQFLDYLVSEPARRIIRRWGYRVTPPNRTPPNKEAPND